MDITQLQIPKDEILQTTKDYDNRDLYILDAQDFKAGRLGDQRRQWSQVLRGYEHETEVRSILFDGLNMREYLETEVPWHEPMNNAKSCKGHEAFIRGQLQTWLDQGVLEYVADREVANTRINGLTVAMENGEPKRLCVHTLHVNNHTKDLPMTLPNTTHLAMAVSPTDTMAKFDMKSGFLQIKLHEESKQYFGIKFDMGRGQRVMRFVVMPWGTNLATAIYQKVQCGAVQYLLDRVVRGCNYIDNAGMAGRARKAGGALCTDSIIAFSLKLFTALGFYMSPKKITWCEQPKMNFLGIGIDAPGQSLFLEPQKVEKLNRLAAELQQPEVSLKRVMKFMGFLNSLRVALPEVGNWVPAMCAELSKHSKADTMITPNELIKQEAQMWLTPDQILSKLPWRGQSVLVPNTVLQRTGLGYSIRVHDLPHNWDCSLINLEEIAEVENKWTAIDSLLHELGDLNKVRYVHVYTDFDPLSAGEELMEESLARNRVQRHHRVAVQLIHSQSVGSVEVVLSKTAQQKLRELTRHKLSVYCFASKTTALKNEHGKSLPFWSLHRGQGETECNFFTQECIPEGAVLHPPRILLVAVANHLCTAQWSDIWLIRGRPRAPQIHDITLQQWAVESRVLGAKGTRGVTNLVKQGRVTASKIRLSRDLMLMRLRT